METSNGGSQSSPQPSPRSDRLVLPASAGVVPRVVAISPRVVAALAAEIAGEAVADSNNGTNTPKWIRSPPFRRTAASQRSSSARLWARVSYYRLSGSEEVVEVATGPVYERCPPMHPRPSSVRRRLSEQPASASGSSPAEEASVVGGHGGFVHYVSERNFAPEPIPRTDAVYLSFESVAPPTPPPREGIVGDMSTSSSNCSCSNPRGLPQQHHQHQHHQDGASSTPTGRHQQAVSPAALPALRPRRPSDSSLPSSSSDYVSHPASSVTSPPRSSVQAPPKPTDHHGDDAPMASSEGIPADTVHGASFERRLLQLLEEADEADLTDRHRPAAVRSRRFQQRLHAFAQRAVAAPLSSAQGVLPATRIAVGTLARRPVRPCRPAGFSFQGRVIPVVREEGAPSSDSDPEPATAATAAEGKDGGSFPVASSSTLPPLVPEAPVAPVDKRWRRRLRALFEVRSQARLPFVADLLHERRGDEEGMLAELVAECGPEPTREELEVLGLCEHTPNDWIRCETLQGNLYYRHLRTDHCQWTHPRTPAGTSSSSRRGSITVVVPPPHKK